MYKEKIEQLLLAVKEGRVAIDEAVEIIGRLAQQNNVLATRATPAIFDGVRAVTPNAEFNEVAGTIVVPHPDRDRTPVTDKKILVITAGTSDIPVAEEAVVTA